MKNYKRGLSRTTAGFTLIELLVVIAIIGILAAIVLASVAGARTKGETAAIQGDMHNIQGQAELVSDNNNNAYNAAGDSVCSGSGFTQDPTIANQMTNIVSDGGSAAACNQSGTTYMIYYTVPAAPSGKAGWCIDSTGDATWESSALTSSATHC